MKKILVLIFAAGIFQACNSNPQQTGSDIIMEKERHDNPIEFQKDSITLSSSENSKTYIPTMPKDTSNQADIKRDSSR